jgi:hydroxyacylglutathione hydrolase
MSETYVVPVPLRMGPMTVMAYLLIGDRVVIVDTGVAEQQGRFLEALTSAGRSPSDVSLIVLTHGHGDHAGSAAALREATSAPIALGAGDEEKCTRGVDREMRGRGVFGRTLLGFIRSRGRGSSSPSRSGPEADIVIDREMSLLPYGVDATVVPTPGHTRGSLAVFTALGDAIVGDTLGGGGRSRSTPQRGIFVCDDRAMDASIAAIMARSPRLVYTGHDVAPFTLEQMRAAFPELG